MLSWLCCNEMGELIGVVRLPVMVGPSSGVCVWGGGGTHRKKGGGGAYRWMYVCVTCMDTCGACGVACLAGHPRQTDGGTMRGMQGIACCC